MGTEENRENFSDVEKAIIFLVEDPFSERDFRRYGFEILQKRGLTPWVFDLSRLLNPHSYANKPRIVECSYKNIVVFEDKNLAKKAMAELANKNLFYSAAGFKLSSLWVYRTLEKLKAQYAVGKNSLHPQSKDLRPRSFFSKVTRALEVLWKNPRLFIFLLFSRLPKTWLGIKRGAAIVLSGGRGALSQKHHASTSYSLIVPCHAMDYDLFLESQSSDPSHPAKQRIVFLDQYLPFHPDWEHGSVFDQKNYFASLDKVFSQIEEYYGIKVSIAAHPRAQYEDKGDCFRGREVVYGNTINLVKESLLVIAHCSTAINFAVFFMRPICFVRTDDFEKDPEMERHMRLFAEMLGRKVIVPEQGMNEDWKQMTTIDSEKYRNYIDMYIKQAGSPEKNTWEIFCDVVLKKPFLKT